MLPLTRFILVAILLSVTVGCSSRTEKIRQKEQVLREDLHSMRQAIDQYTQDKNEAPQGLEDLIRAGYMQSIPKDPLTNSAATWQVVQEDTMQNLDQTRPGITDVHSGSDKISTEGTQYSSW